MDNACIMETSVNTGALAMLALPVMAIIALPSVSLHAFLYEKSSFRISDYSSNPFSEVSCDQVNICHFNAECVYDDVLLKSICICKVGFSGDGIVCTPQGRNDTKDWIVNAFISLLPFEDLCSRSEECDPNAQCNYDETGRRYACKCNPGFYGDGFYCLHQDAKAPIEHQPEGIEITRKTQYILIKILTFIRMWYIE